MLFTKLKKPKIFYIHIPKTGGVSFESILKENFKSNHLCSAYYDSDIAEDPDVFRRRRLVFGHLWYITNELLPDGYETCTILREPVKRALSAYKHIQRDNSHDLHARFSEYDGDIKKMLHDKYLTTNLSNTQTKVLGGDYPLVDTIESVKNNKIPVLEAQKKLRSARVNLEVTEETLTRAKQRLASMKAFGILEYMNESVRWMSSELNLKVENIPELNRAPTTAAEETSTLSHEDMDRLCEANAYDNELYNFAKKVFSVKNPFFDDSGQPLK